jgi:hypothetical protein
MELGIGIALEVIAWGRLGWAEEAGGNIIIYFTGNLGIQWLTPEYKKSWISALIIDNLIIGSVSP